MAARPKPSPCNASGTAVNAGDNSLVPNGITTDQRGPGYPRIAMGTVDIGAYEYNEAAVSGPKFVVNTTDDHDDGVCGPTDCTLREAINAANNDGVDSAITFDATVFATKPTITLNGTQLPNISSKITITGPTAPGAGVSIDGNSKSRLFNVTNTGNLTLANLTLLHGSVNNAQGGGLYNANVGTVSLTNCTLTNNSATYSAGLTNNLSGSAMLTNCTFANNSATTSQAASSTTAAAPRYPQLHLNNSATTAQGGGLVNYGNAALTGCTLANNSASQGGGLFNTSGDSLKLSNSIVAGNNAGTGPDINGTVHSQGYNLIGDGTGSTRLHQRHERRPGRHGR